MFWTVVAIMAGAASLGVLIIMACINWALDYNDEDAGPDPVGEAALLQHPDVQHEKRTRYEVEPMGA